MEWEFEKNGKRLSKVKFSHLEYEKNKFDWQGSQIPLLCFDELTHFSKTMFFYLLTRNRSTCGVRPYVRCTCNPDPDSWVADFIKWWIDEETGYPIPEREGVLRYLVVDGDNYIWGDSAQEVIDKAWYMLKEQVEKSKLDPMHFVKSVTFISGSIYDNRELLSVDPAYLGNLMAQDEATKSALLKGNWKVNLSDDDIYNYYAFQGIFENKYSRIDGKKYITADIAMKGSNKYIVIVWDGFEAIDIAVVDKSNGRQVVDVIETFCKSYEIENRYVTFDNDGAGSFVDGFIVGAIEFNNGSSARIDAENPTKDENGKPIKGNYQNLKTQCYYKSGDRVNKGDYKISELVANKMYDDKMTVRQRFMHERKSIKRDKKDMDGKMKIIPKDQMKVMLNGDSPDLMDAFMMREVFELLPDFTGLQLAF